MPVELRFLCSTTQELDAEVAAYLKGRPAIPTPAPAPELVISTNHVPEILAPDTPASEPPPSEDKLVPTLTLEQLRAKAKDASVVHGTQAIKDLLAEFAVASLTNLSREKYGPFATMLDLLGSGNG